MNISLQTARAGRAIASHSLRNLASSLASPDPIRLAPAAARLWWSILANPQEAARDAGALWHVGAEAGLRATRAMLTGDKGVDRYGRSLQFRDSAWTDSPAFAFLRDLHHAFAAWLVSKADLLAIGDVHERRRARLLARMIADACSPENFPATNPAVLRATRDELGANLLRGLANLAADLERDGWPPRVAKVDRDAFEVGASVATTPGRVIWRTRLFELLHFQPASSEVREVPFLFVPPWINKYYILDLQPEKSMVRWLLDQGHNVFLMSWVNPDATLADACFEDYLLEGALEAVKLVREESGARKVNLAGYCIGGTLLCVLLGHLAKRRGNPVNSCTFFASQSDFSDAGDLMAFTGRETVDQLARRMRREGCLSADSMSASFDLLRPADLYWHFVIRSYYLGEDPGAFDLLYWNADSTCMPARMHEQYLRWFYIENRLARGELVVGGRSVDLASNRIPTFHLAAAEDHIAPPESVYRGSRLAGGDRRFVLAGSGHIAGIINPPNPGKHGFWAEGPGDAENLDAWTRGADCREGSWWPHWGGWLAERSGRMLPAPEPGARLGVLEDAPGSYVRNRKGG